jgi:hypothetical protein
MILILRNSKISSVVSLQAATLFSKQNRGSVNNYLFFKFNTDESIEQIVRMFFWSHFRGDLEDKMAQYKNITNDHGFIYFSPRDNFYSYHRLAL